MYNLYSKYKWTAKRDKTKFTNRDNIIFIFNNNNVNIIRITDNIAPKNAWYKNSLIYFSPL